MPVTRDSKLKLERVLVLANLRGDIASGGSRSASRASKAGCESSTGHVILSRFIALMIISQGQGRPLPKGLVACRAIVEASNDCLEALGAEPAAP